jgi:hypothetical protein
MIKEDDKKKKKGMVVVIALGGKPPKSPEHTADPDDKKKMDDAWRFLKMKETTKTGQPFSNRIARMRAGKETHEQTRMQTGDLEDPTADKEIKPPRLADEVSRPAPTAGTINPASIKKPPVENTRTTINQTPMQDEDEWGRRILDFSDPPNPFQKAVKFSDKNYKIGQ